MTSPTMLLLWVIDDTADHHHIADATARQVGEVAVEHFYTGADALATYRERSAEGRLPDVVLMDYFLGGERGDQVTRRLRAIEATQNRPVIIGYSSVASGSAAIVAAGGDLTLRKVVGGVVNPHLAGYLRSVLDSRS
jgi:CheY-like chemotaxis protein